MAVDWFFVLRKATPLMHCILTCYRYLTLLGMEIEIEGPDDKFALPINTTSRREEPCLSDSSVYRWPGQ